MSRNAILADRAVRGKYAEEKVRDVLKLMSAKDIGFDFERNYDARSSMGRIPRRAGDYTLYYRGGHGLLEVKQLAHAFRLPAKNFDKKKFPILNKRRLAGGVVWVIVYFTPIDAWRIISFDYFDGDRDATSWDLSQFPTFPSALAAMASEDLV